MRGRRGSLSLSVNAIVVLILAIVLLAFGLTFVMKLLGKAGTQFEEMFPAAEIQPTSQRPLGIPDTLVIKAGETKKLTVPILNTLGGTIPETATLTGSGAGCPTSFTVQPLPHEGVPVGETLSLKVIIKGSPNLVHDSICTITLNAGSTIGSMSASYFLSTK